MTSKQKQLNRRDLLVGIGAGILGVATLSRIPIFASEPAYTHYTYATPESLVQVAWVETYNGTVLEAQDGSSGANGTAVLDPNESPAYVPGVDGPVVSLDGLLPGDEGTLVVGFHAENEQARVRLYPRLTATDENGIVEPEAVNGDSTPDAGELQDAILVDVWRDSDLLGGCDGQRGLGDEDVASGTLQSVSDAFGTDGIDLGCLDAGEHSCIGLAWRFDANSTDTQTDSVSFDLLCEATTCGVTE